MTVYAKKKILILYASYGDGHIQVSRALQERLHEEGADAVLVDLFAEAYPILNAITKYVYIKSYSAFPKLYGWSYYSTREMGNDTLFSTWFHSWGMSKLKEILQRERPDGVINTFPMLAMPQLRKKSTDAAVPIFNVLTDFALHRRWIHPLIDRYYVATDDLKADLVAAGVPEHRVQATGIPLKASFRPVERSAALYEKYGLDPGKRTVLIMAGSYGVLQGLRDVCAALSALPRVQLVVVCGKNETLFSSMAETARELPNLRVFGFMKDMHELMSVADTMVTKPGGITLSESIQCELPVVLLRPVPGQERDNAEYLASKGAAFIARTDEEATLRIRALLEHSEQREAAVRSIASLKKTQAAETIVSDVLAHLALSPSESAGSAAADRRRITSERIS